MNAVNHTTLPYFDNLPRYALPALQSAWDQAGGKTFGTQAIFTSFARSMDELGLDAPKRPIMTQWIADVQAGKIARPAAPVAVAKAEPINGLEDADTPIISGKNPDVVTLKLPVGKPFFTQEFPDEKPIKIVYEKAARTSLRAVRDQMVNDLVEQLTADARAQAEAIVVDVLRDLAAEMQRVEV